VARTVKAAQKPRGKPAEAAGRLRISLLGPVTVTAGGAPVPIPSKKARALLGYLAFS
jgi:hypothetical protein